MNKLLDRLSDFLSKYPGLLPLLGIGLVVLNFLLQFFPGNWFTDANVLLHLGVVAGLVGLLLIRPLG
jgi:hypothetical protein